MPWYHHITITAFLGHNLPQMRANLALLAAAIRPLLADRDFGRASLLRWLPEMPRHTGRNGGLCSAVQGQCPHLDRRRLSGIAEEISPASRWCGRW